MRKDFRTAGSTLGSRCFGKVPYECLLNLRTRVVLPLKEATRLSEVRTHAS